MDNKNLYSALLIFALAGLFVAEGCTSSKQEPDQRTEQTLEKEENDSMATVSLTPAQNQYSR